MKIWMALALSAMYFLATDAAIAQQKKPKSEKVYRWVDEEGNVHYSETLPPDFHDKKHDVLDDQGLTRETNQSLVPPPPAPAKNEKNPKGELPRDKSGLQRPAPMYTDAQMQTQKDALLVLRYDSKEEIVDALNVEVRQLVYDIDLLTTSRNSLEKAYKGGMHEMADRQRAGIQLPPEEVKALDTMKRKMVINDHRLADIKKREQEIRAGFDAELERYRFLTEQSEEAAEEQM